MPEHATPDSDARPRPSKLRRHLVVVLILKLLVLTGLWHAFIKPNRVRVDQDVMSARLAGPSSQTNTQGE